MATILKNKSIQGNLLFSIGGLFLVFAICFCAYQYRREKEYKIDILHSRLQMYNYEMVQAIGVSNLADDSLFHAYIKRHSLMGLRVSVINVSGKVVLDSDNPDVGVLENHALRQEVKQAISHGNGFDIKRTSQSTNETYFYSATRFGNYIVRTAVPYSAELTRSLQADNSYIYFTLVLTLLFGIAIFLNTHRIARHIGYLREFAIKAENGKELDHELERRLPDDELGDISHTIIQLYWKLRHSEEEKIQIKRQLTQNAAHELKTPAGSIHGSLESILDNPDMPAEQRRHFLERCYAQSNRMNKLLLDMSTLTKLDSIDSGAVSCSDESPLVDVVSVIQCVLDDTALLLQQKGITPHVSLPEKILLHGDQSLIYSIFRNLIDNVISYATGATELSIGSTTLMENGMKTYRFTVNDNGQGVEEKHLDRLFERFYRVDKGRSRKLGGTGLGLAIVKNAVVVHGGTVRAYTTPGGGLTVVFTMKA